MAILDWFKKSDEEEIKPLRKQDESETEEIPIAEQFSSAIHSGAKQFIINEDIVLTETLKIDVDDLIIDGQHHTIYSAYRDARIFLITSSNVTLKNITFDNGNSSDDGGAIHNLEGDVNIINCKFTKNNAHNGNGGAIYNHHGKVKIEKCKFIDNHSERGDGGAIFNLNGEIDITSCEFKDNGGKFGGAIYNAKTMKLKDAEFANNKSIKGFSVFNADNITFKSCDFEDITDYQIHNLGTISIDMDEKEKIQTVTKGGFIHINSENAKTFKHLKNIIESGEKQINLDFDIINKQFKTGIDISENNITIDGRDCIIDGAGKAIFNISGENVTLKNINFRNGSSFNGGAINNLSDSLEIINCSFECNISNNGGAINNKGSIQLNDCRFSKNIANESDGGAINNKGKLTLTGCKFRGNSSNGNGGAINNMNETVANDCDFESNHAKANGASINNAKYASLKLLDTNFKYNTADRKGSVIFNDNSAELERCEFENNISSKSSNIIFQNGDETSNLNITKCTFSRDRFSNNLIFIENGSCDVDSSTFRFARQRENSYAIYNENGVLTIKKLEFENISLEAVFNNNIIYFEKDMEKYIKPGDDGLPFNYL